MKTVEKPAALSALRKAAYTSPVSGTTSMVGSYWAFDPFAPHRGTCAPQLRPPSWETVRARYGLGQWELHVFGWPYRVVRMYTYGALGSVATAGSQSSVSGFNSCEPTQPGAGFVTVVAVDAASAPKFPDSRA